MNLNKEQREFIYEKGSVVLSACPGSGKTTALAYKFLELVKDISRNAGVALLSFTNVAAQEIKDKIRNISMTNEIFGYPHFVGTIDSFFNSIILRFGYLYFKCNPQIILNFNGYKIKDCYRCINKNWDGYFDILGKYKINKEEIICKNGSFNCLNYICKMGKKGIINQGSVPYFLKQMLDKFPKIIDIIVKRYPIILLDEAQDISAEQDEILNLLYKHGCILNYIGDSDQAIYEWRNADVDIFRNKMRNNEFKQIKFYRNNRSSQIICDATKVFGCELSKYDEYISEAYHKECSIRPTLIKYKKSTYEQVKNVFLEIVKKNNLSIDKTTTAIVHRYKNKNNTLSYEDIYNDDNKFMDFYLNGIYCFFYGDRGKGKKLLQCAFSYYIYGNEFIELSNIVNGEVIFNDFLRTIVFSDMPIRNWEKETLKKLECFLKKYNFAFKDKYFKLKARLNNVSKYKENINFKSLFSISNKEFYIDSTIHGVKGETFDSLLLITELKGKINGKTLLSDDLNNESSRLAFVAMTRPKYLLCVAVQNELDYSKKFPAKYWDYLEIE